MPWKESSFMEERLRFVARLLDGESMGYMCRQFGISRKTGYKIYNCYKEHGLEALSDRSRRPVRYANQLPAQLEQMIVCLKKEKPHWDARKIRELLVHRLAGDVRIPAKSTVHAGALQTNHACGYFLNRKPNLERPSNKGTSVSFCSDMRRYRAIGIV